MSGSTVPAPTRIFLALTLFIATSACRGTTDPDPLVGTYLATTFQVAAPTGAINVLGLGGTLGLNVANNYVTTGTLIVPASVAGATYTASMAGTAVRTGSTVRFIQSADSFVRDLTFTLAGDSLAVVNQTVAGTTYEIVLTRQ